MTKLAKQRIKESYFDWMYDKVLGFSSRRINYHKLFRHLNNVPFVYPMDMDQNRANDGVSLRYRFGREEGVAEWKIDEAFGKTKCSILEMMLALAIRCEDNIMSDDDYGDRTGQWFWSMIVSLGLNGEVDRSYDEDKVDIILERFVRREYEPNGRGGLFTVERSDVDMREIEIWYQMHLYLQEEFE